MRAVFLDRDGIVNKAVVRDGRPHPPANLGEFEFVEGIHQVLAVLRQRGFLLIGTTNQPDVARGIQSKTDVETIHRRILEVLPIDRIYCCYHDNSDRCSCRKPKPGMLLRGAQEFEIALADSFMVGDRWRDIEAGLAAGCKTVYVDYGYDEKLTLAPHYSVESVQEILNHIE